MRQLLEFVPIALFFIVYQLDGETVSLGGWSHTVDGIFTATAVLMAATALQVAVTYALTRKLEKRLLWMLAAVLVFGGATLLGYGAAVAGGCTSGHGMCGTAQRSPASMAVTATFMTTAILTTLALRIVTGGDL